MENIFSLTPRPILTTNENKTFDESQILLEESTIDGNSILPSFIECCSFLPNTSTTIYDTVRHVSIRCQEKVQRLLLRWLRERVRDDNVNISSNSGSSNYDDNYSEWINAFWMCFIEFMCLKRFDALLAEVMFGFQRAKCVRLKAEGTNNIDGTRSARLINLSGKDRLRAATLSVALYYLKNHLKDASLEGFSSVDASRDENRISMKCAAIRNSWKKFAKIFSMLRPYLLMTLNGLEFSHNWLFLFNLSWHPCIELNMLQIVLRRQRDPDGYQNEIQSTNYRNPKTFAFKNSSVNRLAIGWGAAIVLFAINYWKYFETKLIEGRKDSISAQCSCLLRRNDVKSNAHFSCSRCFLPPPISKDTTPDNSTDSDLEYGHCPICHISDVGIGNNQVSSSKHIVFPTVCATSGYVYCYKCILLHFRKNGHFCPVSGIKCRKNDLIPLQDVN